MSWNLLSVTIIKLYDSKTVLYDNIIQLYAAPIMLYVTHLQFPLNRRCRSNNTRTTHLQNRFFFQFSPHNPHPEHRRGYGVAEATRLASLQSGLLRKASPERRSAFNHFTFFIQNELESAIRHHYQAIRQHNPLIRHLKTYIRPITSPLPNKPPKKSSADQSPRRITILYQKIRFSLSASKKWAFSISKASGI